MNDRATTKPKSASRRAETPFQQELVRLIARHNTELPAFSGRALSAALGKSANHLWIILNRGMVPSGAAVLDLARVLKLSTAETDGLILKAIETKAQVRSRDQFWINEAARIARSRDDEIRALRAYVQDLGRLEEFDRRLRARPDSGAADGADSVSAP